jgi:hypothetical protein
MNAKIEEEFFHLHENIQSMHYHINVSNGVLDILSTLPTRYIVKEELNKNVDYLTGMLDTIKNRHQDLSVCSQLLDNLYKNDCDTIAKDIPVIEEKLRQLTRRNAAPISY